MAEKIFLLGRPGSGKSEAARYIEKTVEQQKIPFHHTGDYHILYGMYRANEKHEQFEPADPKRPELGFTVKDSSVLDDALIRLQKEIEKIGQGLVVIEFARDDYKSAFEQLPSNFYKECPVMFFESDLNTCIKRVFSRISDIEHINAHTNLIEKLVDNHLITEDVMRRYYSKNNWEYMIDPNRFIKDFSIAQGSFFASRNEGTSDALLKQVKDYLIKIGMYPALSSL